jgi:FAD:protein FMN transferase
MTAGGGRTTEASATFDCFGSTCAVLVTGDGPRSAAQAVEDSRRSLLAWHHRFTRFAAASELSLLNEDPRPAVEVSAIMARFVGAARATAEASGGLVDPTQLDSIERAGYRVDLGAPLPLPLALALAPARRPAAPGPRQAWRELEVADRTIRRPPGLRLDSGGVVKGLLADVLAETLAGHEAFAIDCAGDLRLGGTPREVRVESPFDGSAIHSFVLGDAAVATSGIGRRSWLHAGRPMHHLLDPSTGRPAFTGIVQATALAPTGVEAEWRAKAAVLSGPRGAPDQLPYGGLLVFDDGSHALVSAAATRAAAGDGGRSARASWIEASTGAPRSGRNTTPSRRTAA